MSELKKTPWALLFLISFGINLFLGGMLVAGRMHRGGGRESQPEGMNAIAAPYKPHAQRIWKERRGELQDKKRKVQEARARVAEAMTAEPFDPARATAALADLRAAQADAQRVMHEGMVELAKELPKSERARLPIITRGLSGQLGPGRQNRRGMGPHDMMGPDPSSSAPRE